MESIRMRKKQRQGRFKKLLHVIMGIGESKIYRTGQHIKTQGRVDAVNLSLQVIWK